MHQVTRKPVANELSLVNPSFLAIKAGMATALAIALDGLIGNPDRVTATFVAVLCVSPTVLAGVRRATAQFLGSLIGGALGTGAAAIGLPLVAGIPLSVAAAIYGSFAIGYPSGYVVAAFTALFVQAVPRGTPLATYGVRLEAVLVGALSAFLVNLIVSALFYNAIFERRLQAVELAVDGLLEQAALRGAQAVEPGFGMLRTLHGEIEVALEETRLHPRRRAAPVLQRIDGRVQDLARLLHLVYDLGVEASEVGVPRLELTPLLQWLRAPEGEPPAPPPGVERATAHVIAHRVRIDARRGPVQV